MQEFVVNALGDLHYQLAKFWGSKVALMTKQDCSSLGRTIYVYWPDSF
jgi:hypothetical protein